MGCSVKRRRSTCALPLKRLPFVNWMFLGEAYVMFVRRVAARRLTFSVATAALLAGCASTPLGPTVQVMPGPGKTLDAFQTDNNACKAFAAGAVQGQAGAANQRAA